VIVHDDHDDVALSGSQFGVVHLSPDFGGYMGSDVRAVSHYEVLCDPQMRSDPRLLCS
jgi:hypothetical protein